MVAAAPVFTRERIDRTAGPVPLAFVFDDSPVQPEHIVTVVSWSLAALPLLRDLHKHFANLAPRQSLPVEALRGRLEVNDADNLRLDRGLGLWGRSPAILWTSCAAELARERVSSAVLGWLVNDVEVDEAAATDLVQRLRHLARAGQVVEVARRTAQVFCWEQTRSGTATGARTNREGYADLADFVVRQLEGKELLRLSRLRGQCDARRLDPATTNAAPHGRRAPGRRAPSGDAGGCTKSRARRRRPCAPPRASATGAGRGVRP